VVSAVLTQISLYLVKVRLAEIAALLNSMVILQLISTTWGFSLLVDINEACRVLSEGDRHFTDKTELADLIWSFHLLF